MKPSTATAALVLGLIASPASGQTFTFAGLAWGANAVTVQRAMTSQGLVFSHVDEDGDLTFVGALVQETAVVQAFMTPQRELSRIDVNLLTRAQDAREVYRSMKQTLITKYGDPEQCIETFLPPYYDGDGFEEQAIRLGKGLFDCIWGKETTGMLDIRILDDLTVHIGYESPGWNAGEGPRRKAKRTRAF